VKHIAANSQRAPEQFAQKMPQYKGKSRKHSLSMLDNPQPKGKSSDAYWECQCFFSNLNGALQGNKNHSTGMKSDI
jgi:hypothetical protein